MSYRWQHGGCISPSSEDLLGSAEWWLGVGFPALLAQGIPSGDLEARALLHVARQPYLVAGDRSVEQVDEPTGEFFRQGFDVEKEGGVGRNPLTVRIETAAGHDEVDVGMS